MSMIGTGAHRLGVARFWRRLRCTLRGARRDHWTRHLRREGPADLCFDEGYYLQQAPAAAAAVAAGKMQSVVEHYRRVGLWEGHYPNVIFDESTYLNANPDVARAVAAGVYDCGFHHYVSVGWSGGRKPNGLIVDEAWYRRRHPELAEELAAGSCRSASEHYVLFGAARGWDPHPAFAEDWYRQVYRSEVEPALAAGRFISAYHHYDQVGCQQGLRPNPIFNEQEYLKLYPDVARGVAAGAHRSAFHHFLARGWGEGRRQSSLAVGEEWYRETYPDADRAIESGAFADALSHYLSRGAADGRDPHPAFSEAWYRHVHRVELAEPLAARQYLSGYHHYWEEGFRRGLRPHPGFNEAEYLDLYPEVAEKVQHSAVISAFHHYLLCGFAEGRRPNKLIVDEGWYRRAHPDADRAIRAGVYRDAYEHYVHQGAAEGRDPHPAFSEAWYRATYDVELGLAANTSEYLCGYQHYLERGHEMGFRPHPSFSADDYLRLNPDVAAGVARGELASAFHHYLLTGYAEGRRPNGMVVHERWYREVYPDVDHAICDGAFVDAYDHYLRRGAAEGRDPHPAFSESWYRQTYSADVAPAFDSGYYLCGYQHFLERGLHAGFKPHPAYAEEDYRQRHPDVDRLVREGSWPSAYLHLISIGLEEGRQWRSLSPLAQLKHASSCRMRAALEQFLSSGRDLELPHSDEPEVSVVTVLFNRAEHSLACFRSLMQLNSPSLELVIVDNASSDETSSLLERLRGVRVIRNQENLGFIEASNQGAAVARGTALLFLNNDTELDPFTVQAALHTLRSWPSAGAVGGRIVRLDGLLEEAGGIVWHDGTTCPYGAGDDARSGAYLFPRPVDYCTGAFLLVDRAAFRRLGGFDSRYKPAYFEDVDLCFRLRGELGLDTVYEPRALVYHHGSASATNSQRSEDLWRANRVKFCQQHQRVLDKHLRPDESTAYLAMDRREFSSRILLIDELGSPQDAMGLSNSLFGEEREGAHITLFATRPVTGCSVYEPRSSHSTAFEVICHLGVAGLESFLSGRKGFYSRVLVGDGVDVEGVVARLDELVRRGAGLPLEIASTVTPEQ